RAFALPVILGLLLGALCGVCFAPVLWCKLADLLEKYKATSDARKKRISGKGKKDKHTKKKRAGKPA
ncbi:MAG: hypothetical protein ACOX88_10490, partial [Christensenellales bacterium]